jgi:hypothetical protein
VIWQCSACGIVWCSVVFVIMVITISVNCDVL